MRPMTASIYGTPAIDQLGVLRDQRALLSRLRDDVHECWQRLAATTADDSWSSRAQRAYADRVECLRGELHAVVRLLDDAQASVNESIDRVQAGA